MAHGCCLVLVASCCAADGHRPETWFHLINGNVSREGLVADLDAIRDAGIGGIQLFHGGGDGMGGVFPGMENRQTPCLSADWDGLVAFIAQACRERGLSFKMQNCPGWSMSGGPWIAPTNAMRILVCGRQDFTSDGRTPVSARLPELQTVQTVRPQRPTEPWRDVREIAVVAFPSQGEGEALPEPAVTTADPAPTNKVITFAFDRPVTVRSVTLPSPRAVFHDRCYEPDVHVTIAAEDGAVLRSFDYPRGCWQDYVPLTVACRPTMSRRFTVTVAHKWKKCEMTGVTLSSQSRYDNWQGEAGWTLRGLFPEGSAPDCGDAIRLMDVRRVTPGETVLPAGRWTVMRFAHVNAGRRNGPAPQEATGWECDKLDAGGIDCNFANYIGRLADGPLSGGLLQGVVVDSWECERPNWTERLPERWAAAHPGTDLVRHLPALVGHAVGSSAGTAAFLRDWRAFVGHEIEERYYRRMAELAHAKGLGVQYETAFGDVLPGDPLRFWKYCDTPMCEFWLPHSEGLGSVHSHNFKPVRPCVSAAHIYGKGRVTAEAFTSCGLNWISTFKDFKAIADRHFALGVTHIVFHTYTHNPRTDWKAPGTSFGCALGSAFLRGQTWWPYMRELTDYFTACSRELERGKPVVDVLRYLGDAVGHRPHELSPFPQGWKYDYLNRDALFERLDAKDGRLVLPDGLSYAVLWVPDERMLRADTAKRLDALAAKGARIVRGDVDALCRALEKSVPPDLTRFGREIHAVASNPDEEPLRWYHRRDGDEDVYFLWAKQAVSGRYSFRTAKGTVGQDVSLVENQSAFLRFRDGACSVATYPGCVPVKGGHEIALEPTDRPLGWWRDLGGTPGEKAFSGTRAYRTAFSLKAIPGRGERLVLDLGEVAAWATVSVNGRPAAKLWCPPYCCDLTPFVREGRNELTVEVTSTWHNRLAYDAGLPEAERQTWTLQGPKADSALRPSGLKGPLKLAIK